MCPATVTAITTAEAAVSDSRRRPTVNLPVVVEQNPLVACCLVEATLHASTAYSGPPGTDANAAAAAVARLQHASITCFAATLAVPVLTDAVLNTLAARAASAQREAAPTAVGATTAAGALPAAAGQQAAAPVVAAPYAHGSSYCSRLEQKLFCVLVAALKYSQASIALQGPSTAALGPYFNAMALLCVCSSAAIRMLGNVNGPQHTLGDDTTSASARPVAAAAAVVELQARGFEQLIWLDVMGRLLVAAGQLLQQVPQRVTASGDCVLTDRTRPQHNQFARYVDLLQALLLSVKALGMLGVLGQGEAAAATAVAAGTAAATTQADLSRLQQQATGLRKQVEDIQASFEYGVRGMMAQEHAAGVKAMQQLHAACKEGGLPQQLYSFGVAYCAAFPQRGCCGNPACVNLDKFTETALACQGCSGCDKVSVIRVQRYVSDGLGLFNGTDCANTNSSKVCGVYGKAVASPPDVPAGDVVLSSDCGTLCKSSCPQTVPYSEAYQVAPRQGLQHACHSCHHRLCLAVPPDVTHTPAGLLLVFTLGCCRLSSSAVQHATRELGSMDTRQHVQS